MVKRDNGWWKCCEPVKLYNAKVCFLFQQHIMSKHYIAGTVWAATQLRRQALNWQLEGVSLLYLVI